MKKKIKLGNLANYLFEEIVSKPFSVDVDRRYIANVNRKIMRKKAFKFNGTEYNVEEYAKTSVEKAIISRIDALTNNSIIDGNGKTNISLRNIVDDEAIWNAARENVSPLIVEICGKKKVSDFNAIYAGFIDTLGRISNFPMIWNSIKPKWESILNEVKDTSDTYILYVPGVKVYLDSFGHPMEPKDVNVLLVAVAAAKYIKDRKPLEVLSEQDVCNFIVGDTLQAMTYIGSHPVVMIEPFKYKYLDKHFQAAANAWKAGSLNKSFNNTIKELRFIVHSESALSIAKSLFK